MISQLWKAALLSLIILSGTMAQHSRRFDQFRSHLNRRAVPTVPGNTNSRSDVVWGGEDGWNLSELELLMYSLDVHFEVYSEEEYVQAETGTDQGYEYLNMYLPTGWFRTLEGKTVVTKTWEAAKYMQDGTVIDGGEFNTFDSLVVAAGQVEDNYNWRGSAGQMIINFNEKDQVDSVLLNGAFSHYFDHIFFEYVNGSLVSHTVLAKDEIKRQHTLIYNDGILAESNELSYGTIESENVDRFYQYEFVDGICRNIKISDKDVLGEWIQKSNFSLEYDENGNMTEAISYTKNSSGVVIGYGGGSAKFTYTPEGYLQTRERYYTGVKSYDTTEVLPWNPYEKDSTAYDENGNIIEEYDFTRSESNSDWTLSAFPRYYHYDSNNNLIRYSSWDDTEPDYVVTYKDGYPESIIQKDENDSVYSYTTFKFYDNPASIDPVSVQKEISFSVAENVVTLNHISKVSPLKLYTVSGKEVAEIAPEQFGSSVKFNLKQSNIAQGVYIGKITADGSALEQKLVIR